VDLLLQTFPADMAAVGQARHAVEHALESSGLSQFVDRARLVVDELVWNVVIHAETPAVVRVTGDVEHVMVTVGDGAGGTPAVGHAAPEAVAGRGLVIVDGIADEWGWQPVDGGKVVWVRLDAGSARAMSGEAVTTTL
jgi:anti-sigma regulatory factor (Ser/Thr protein kinase)